MYVKRTQIINYGPIDRLDITFPFEGDTPKPIILVGENGSGKSILLSHIVNGLISAKDLIYPDTPEVEKGKVYKIRSGFYIKSKKEFYFARVDFQDSLFIEEIRSEHLKETYPNPPAELTGQEAQAAWGKMEPKKGDYLDPNIYSKEAEVRDIFSRNCVLYFPPNRFEEPAWLNEENLIAKAEYIDLRHMVGHTDRKIINYSPLHDNQNWLFEVIYDRAAFEINTRNYNVPVKDSEMPVSLPLFLGYSGQATSIHEVALQIVRSIIRKGPNIRFGIGGRQNRVVSVEGESGQLVPNIFQLSSGETSLLNLFLSILRDFDLSNLSLTKPEDVRGIVVVDEIDLHLHVAHQYTILPQLIKMFPNVQFVVTTHSPLFVLGMKHLYGEDGFALHRLPHGQQISPEEFSEFESAYQSFSQTRTFSDDIRTAIKNAQKPIVFAEGATDVKYLQRAAELLGHGELIGRIELKDGGGADNLDKIWKKYKEISEVIPQRMVLLYDCDRSKPLENNGNLFRRNIPLQSSHPIEKGIENLFSQSTLEKAREHKSDFITVTSEYVVTERGESKTVPEKWEVHSDEKTNLCTWLCENGTKDDFQYFQTVFELLEEALGGGSN